MVLRIQSIVLLVSLAATSCVRKNQSIDTGSGSGLSEIKVQPPSEPDFRSQFGAKCESVRLTGSTPSANDNCPAVIALLSKYRISVTEHKGINGESSCTSGVVASEVIKDGELSSATIQESVKKGCDYDLLFEIGRDAGGTFEPLFDNSATKSMLVPKAELESGLARVRVILEATPNGVRAGFPAGADINTVPPATSNNGLPNGNSGVPDGSGIPGGSNPGNGNPGFPGGGNNQGPGVNNDADVSIDVRFGNQTQPTAPTGATGATGATGRTGTSNGGAGTPNNNPTNNTPVNPNGPLVIPGVGPTIPNRTAPGINGNSTVPNNSVGVGPLAGTFVTECKPVPFAVSQFDQITVSINGGDIKGKRVVSSDKFCKDKAMMLMTVDAVAKFTARPRADLGAKAFEMDIKLVSNSIELLQDPAVASWNKAKACGVGPWAKGVKVDVIAKGSKEPGCTLDCLSVFRAFDIARIEPSGDLAVGRKIKDINFDGEQMDYIFGLKKEERPNEFGRVLSRVVNQ